MLTWQGVWSYLFPFLEVAGILLICHFVIKYIMRFVKRAFTKTKLDPSLVKYCANAITIVIYIFVILAGLDAVGVSTSSIVAAFSAAVLASGVALKDSLSNLAGGILLLFSPRFSTGDYIEAGGDEGYVISVELLHTTLQTYDARQVSIPNSILVNSHIINYTKENKRRIDIEFAVDYEADINKAKRVAYNTIARHPLSLLEPDKPFVRVTGCSDGAVKIMTRTWCSNEDYWTLYYDIIENVYEEFGKNGIKLPHSQMDVHLRAQAAKSAEIPENERIAYLKNAQLNR